MRKNVEPDYVCRTPGKHPRRRAWETLATNDPAEVEKMWRRNPQNNIGIAAGKSGLLVIDADLYKEHAGAVPFDDDTVTSLTGGGGEHLVFKMPEGATYGNHTGNLPHGLDIRGFGGQFVAPPSVHPSGNFYEWEADYGPHERGPAELPRELRAMLDDAGQKQSRVQVAFSADSSKPDLAEWKLPALVQAVIEGDRSRIAQCVISSLVKAGASDDDIHAVFQHFDVTGKYKDKGNDGDRWLAVSIGNARAWVASRSIVPEKVAA